jgi:hypothetical protein
MEESMAGHGVRKGITKGGMVGPGRSWRQTECFSFLGAYKTYATYRKGRSW